MRSLRTFGARIGVTLWLAAFASCRGSAAPPPGPYAWRSLAPGLDYRSHEENGTRFHLVRAHLDRIQVRVADARGQPERAVATVDVLAHETKALVALNGTFFDESNRPLGLVVSDGRELNPLRDISWWAALIVRQAGGRPRAEILTTEQLRKLPREERTRLEAALQVGPRTVVDGRVLKLKNQTAARSAVCILSDDELILLATELKPLESNALAEFMARPAERGGLACRQGLMFDGGPSTQLHLATPSLALDVPGGWGVPNALILQQRPAPAAPASKDSKGPLRD